MVLRNIEFQILKINYWLMSITKIIFHSHVDAWTLDRDKKTQIYGKKSSFFIIFIAIQKMSKDTF